MEIEEVPDRIRKLEADISQLIFEFNKEVKGVAVDEIHLLNCERIGSANTVVSVGVRFLWHTGGVVRPPRYP